MEEDIQNHSPTVMFRGTPCIIIFSKNIQIIVFRLLLLELKIENDFLFLMFFLSLKL